MAWLCLEGREGSADSTSDDQIGLGKERVELSGVLGQAAIAHFSKFKEVLDDVKGMLDHGAGLEFTVLPTDR